MKINRMVLWMTVGFCAGFGSPLSGQQTALPVSVQQTSTKPLVQVDTVLIELNRYGFFPAQVKHAANQHFLFVHNVSGIKTFSLSIKAAGGTVFGSAATTAMNPHWMQLLNLAPGTYTVTEAAHPTWSCTITLQ